MRRFLDWSLTLVLVVALLGPAMARAQARGRWHVADGDAAHDSWQKTESKISTTTVASSFKLLWKLKLGNQTSQTDGFSEPLATPSIISARGFKDIVLWGDSNSLYAVDYALGTLLWQQELSRRVCGFQRRLSRVACPNRYGAATCHSLWRPAVPHLRFHFRGSASSDCGSLDWRSGSGRRLFAEGSLRADW